MHLKAVDVLRLIVDVHPMVVAVEKNQRVNGGVQVPMKIPLEGLQNF